jgi:hypothetical protein
MTRMNCGFYANWFQLITTGVLCFLSVSVWLFSYFLLWLTSNGHGLSKTGPKTVTRPDLKALMKSYQFICFLFAITHSNHFFPQQLEHDFPFWKHLHGFGGHFPTSTHIQLHWSLDRILLLIVCRIAWVWTQFTQTNQQHKSKSPKRVPKLASTHYDPCSSLISFLQWKAMQ